MSDDIMDLLDEVELEELDTTIEEELADVELPPEPDGDIVDEMDEIEVPDGDGTADFEEFSGAFIPGLGDVYAAGGTFIVEGILGAKSSGSGMKLIQTDRGEFAHPKSLRVGQRYRADDEGEGITLEEVSDDE
jgi:hypothetical protein